MQKFSNERGQALVFVAVSMSVLLGFTAFATDVGVLMHVKREAQTAADSAAIGAATEALAEGNPTTLTSGEYNAGKTDASLNGFTGGSSTGTLNSSTGTTLSVNIAPNITDPAFNKAGYVQAVISQTNPTLFMKVFMGLFGNSGFSGMTVGASAIASDIIAANGCIYVTNPGLAASPAVFMSGQSLILAKQCGVSINGDLGFNGNKADVTAKFVAVSGTISNTGDITGPFAENIPPQPNPLAALDLTTNEPTPGTTPGGACKAPAGSTLPCIYDLGNGNLNSTTVPTGGLPSGIYYFDVPVTISGAVSSAATTSAQNGVVFYIAGNNSFNFDANGTLTLFPPNTPGDTFNNILIDAPDDSGQTTCKSGKGNNAGNPGELYFDFGSSTTTLNGIVYAPNAQLFEQDSGATMSLNTDLVIGNICMQSATFTVNGLTNGSPISKVALVY